MGFAYNRFGRAKIQQLPTFPETAGELAFCGESCGQTHASVR